MKSLVWLLKYLLADAGRRCGAPTDRDYSYVTARVEQEGDSFLTITLGTFARDFERCLDRGYVVSTDFPNFRKSGALPSFLKGFARQVFDTRGYLLPNASSDCILAIRQVCLFAKKILRPCAEHRLKSAEAAFKECDREVKDEVDETPLWRAFKGVCRIILADISDNGFYEELVPRHGPGTTAQGIRGNSKYSWEYWTSRLEERFPFSEFAIGSARNLFESSTPDPDFTEPADEMPVRVVFVPKTLKTPRVIAIEPVCMQYAQQAVAGYLIPRIERGYYTRGRVNFRRQDINQALALDSSRSGFYATLDMSEASDRVSYAMAKAVFDVHPELWELIDSCRSQRAKLPSGDIVPLKKFASMGSALCFPVESMVFYCAIIASRIVRAKEAVTPRRVYLRSRDVFVYGDDLIVPSGEAPNVCDDLESLGLKVNRHKSFWTGKFRESCGVDAYDGKKVTPVYLRRDLPAHRADSSGILSAVATANQLFDAGWCSTAMAIKEAIEEIVGLLPTVPPESQAIGWSFYSGNSPRLRWNRDLQRSEMRCFVPSVRKVKDPLDGDPALVKCFTLIGNPDIDVQHLHESVGTGHLALKRRWVSTN